VLVASKPPIFQPIPGLRQVSRSTACARPQQKLAASGNGSRPSTLATGKPTPISYATELQTPTPPPEAKAFVLDRGRQVGGPQLNLGRESPCGSPTYEFKAAARDGHGPCWPIENQDLAPY